MRLFAMKGLTISPKHDTRRKLEAHETLIWRPGRNLSVLTTLKFGCGSTEKLEPF